MTMASRPIYTLGLPQHTTRKLGQCGYETLQDLLNTPAQSLASDLGITPQEAESLLLTSKAPSASLAISSTQSAASLAKQGQHFSTGSTVVDSLLQGGLMPGHILEVSGPPGAPRERIAIGTARSAAAAGHEVIFVDMQNMTLLDDLKDLQEEENSSLISYLKMHSLSELLGFMHKLLPFLDSRPKVALLVLNSISFPFQSSNLTMSAKSALLDRMKKSLAASTQSKHLAVITTSHLATKILNSDGTLGNFDTGARGVMVPQLGPNYLPSGRTFRIVFAADGPTTGFVKVLSSPKDPLGENPSPPVFYAMDDDGIVQFRKYS